MLSSQVFLRDTPVVEQVMLFGGSKLAPAPAPAPVEERLAAPVENASRPGGHPRRRGVRQIVHEGRRRPPPSPMLNGTARRVELLAAATVDADADASSMSILDDWIVVHSSCADTSGCSWT